MNDTTAINSGTTGAAHQLHFYILAEDWTWWAWTLTAILLAIGLAGYPSAFIAAMVITTVQAIVMLIREKSFSAFPVQLRIAYCLLLAISFIPQMRWLTGFQRLERLA
jgi:hypothetical protein